MDKRPIFSDPARQKEFDDNGFVKIQLLSPAEADALYAFYESVSGQHSSEHSLHHTTTETRDRDLILRVDQRIKEAFTPALARYMTGYKGLASCFHIKESGTGSATGLHQDPTFVDDSRYYSANIWCALHDIDSAKGNLYFVKGTNRVCSLRPVPSYPSYYSEVQDMARENRIEVPLQKGEAVIFQNATIHGATDNVSGSKRLAATLLVASEEAQWCMLYNEAHEQTGRLARYDLDMDAFIDFNIHHRPPIQALRGEEPYTFPSLDRAQFEKLLFPDRVEQRPRRSWFSSLLQSIGQ